MREYTIQYLQAMEWHRVDAIYDNPDDVRTVVADMAFDGLITRILGRDRKDDYWQTIYIDASGRIALRDIVYSCPK